MTEHETPRSWFITGASSGVGRAVAAAALARGDRVAAAARKPDAVADLAEHFPGQALAVELDVHDEQAAQLAVARTVEAFGRIDVVVNSAGYGVLGAVEATTDAQARAIFDTNVFGVLNVLRAVLPVLRGQRAGHVLQVSSNLGQLALPGTGLLAATKHALSGLTEALAAELSPLGVRFTLLEPGAIATPFLARVVLAHPMPDYEQTAGAMVKQLGQLPAEALTDPDRIAAAVLAAADAPEPPLRLALGAASADSIRTALTTRLRELDSWSPITRAVDG
jgi:NAD(P)-dependent dehydrogenase (short-subunit alcohol dehydrogenase family)